MWPLLANLGFRMAAEIQGIQPNLTISVFNHDIISYFLYVMNVIIE